MSKLNPIILEEAVKLATKHGYQNVTREQIATAAGVGAGTVNLHYSSMAQLRKTIVRHAVRTENNRIIAQAIVAGEPYVKRKLSAAHRKQVLMSVA